MDWQLFFLGGLAHIVFKGHLDYSVNYRLVAGVSDLAVQIAYGCASEVLGGAGFEIGEFQIRGVRRGSAGFVCSERKMRTIAPTTTATITTPIRTGRKLESGDSIAELEFGSSRPGMARLYPGSGQASAISRADGSSGRPIFGLRILIGSGKQWTARVRDAFQ